MGAAEVRVDTVIGTRDAGPVERGTASSNPDRDFIAVAGECHLLNSLIQSGGKIKIEPGHCVEQS